MNRWQNRDLPHDDLPTEGALTEDDWLVYFKQNIAKVNLDTVYSHVFNNRDREVGGVLVGVKSPMGKLPLVTGAIGAISADEQRATLTFTQESWEHVHRDMEEFFPNSDIVGWYHSHPGFGIFLSEHDLFIHHNFFDHPSQVALVVDPVAGSEGVFMWSGDHVVPVYEQDTAVGWGPISLSDLERHEQEALAAEALEAAGIESAVEPGRQTTMEEQRHDT